MLCASLAMSATAVAQACNVTLFGDIGEVTVERDAQGATATWAVYRYVSDEETKSLFASPGLELQFALKADGSLGALGMLEVPITRISDPESGRTPSLRNVEVKAALDGGRKLSWRAMESADGRAQLMRALQTSWPQKLELQLVASDDGHVHASAVFDLTMLGKARELARQANATCGG
jgi:hypothetical protein